MKHNHPGLKFCRKSWKSHLCEIKGLRGAKESILSRAIFSERMRDGSSLPQCTALVDSWNLQHEILGEETKLHFHPRSLERGKEQHFPRSTRVVKALQHLQFLPGIC